MNQNPTIEGIYEVCIGITEPMPMIEYWQQFGYRIGKTGELTAPTVNNLYGVNSNLRSIRLYHQNVDHGLIRLMVWEKPTNEGLEMTSMRVLGNRWATTLTTDVLNILNHAEDAYLTGLPIKCTFPQWEIIYKTDKGRPFFDPAVGVREMMLLQPLTRQVLFQRFNYTVPEYGKINHASTLKTSQFTHAGMIVQDDSKETLQFYEDVLGLLRSRDNSETSYESSEAARQIFDLQPGEKFTVTTFDDPRSSTNWQEARSGRMYIIRFPEEIKLQSCFEQSQPGCLGMSLYTYRVSNIKYYFERVKNSAATKITDIVNNEFGEQSFSFVAPDGYLWNLISK
ncbi:MAG: VOC family protein [Okeania sp. SIO3I5]|uniref:VOC family protein n=1 Tax=Okeania sp. SIO3I5 TaxID=2607805 RepID=UPI0013B7D03E|nr:VOC family protein [Okeania sp. SIO3I5]NEQ39203.1 VOC family protein [Okeania sp. SIO3I5]